MDMSNIWFLKLGMGMSMYISISFPNIYTHPHFKLLKHLVLGNLKKLSLLSLLTLVFLVLSFISFGKPFFLSFFCYTIFHLFSIIVWLIQYSQSLFWSLGYIFFITTFITHFFIHAFSFKWCFAFHETQTSISLNQIDFRAHILLFLLLFNIFFLFSY